MARGPYLHSDRELLQRLGKSAGGKAGYKQLVRELGLGGGRERRLLVEQLTRMVARRELVQLEAGLWAIPRPEARSGGSEGTAATPTTSASANSQRGGQDRLISGRLDLHRDGFGFVRPDPGTSRAGAMGDIFIPPPELNGAMQGDLVLVDEAPFGRDGRRSGRIARVLTRNNPTVVGIFHYARSQPRAAEQGQFGLAGASGNYVVPIDERVASFIDIPEGAELAVEAGESPHRVLGAEARRRAEIATPQIGPDDAAQSSGPQGNAANARWPLEGMAVDVELTHFPASGRPARGRVLEVLGKPEDFGVDVEIVIRKHHLPHTFPPSVLHEAEERSALSVESLERSDPPEFARRQDFRGFPVVTIDGDTARDFDDAILVRPLDNGHTELQVHIADVSAYVLPRSALDTEARVRGTSVYFPDRAVPMLPAALSSGMCSLRPDEDRLVLSCVMEIDTRGEIVAYRVTEGLIRSLRRCTYTEVQHCLNASASREVWNGSLAPRPIQDAAANEGGKLPRTRPITPEPEAEDFAERERIGLEQPELLAALDRMLDLALRLNAKRVRRGSIDFDLPEPVVEFDPDGNMKAIVRSERGWAHRLIEEFMLSANECVATWLTAQAIPSIYRIHEMPDPKRVLDFEEQAAGFGQTLGVGALPVKRLTMKSDRREVQRRSARGRAGAPAQAHEVPAAIEVTPQMYQRLVRRMSGKPEERILAYLMLRSLKQARYAEQNVGHFALASPCYTHFTSPIRRYPDLIVHRLVRAMLRRGANSRGGAVLSTDPQPWKHTGAVKAAGQAAKQTAGPAGMAFRREESPGSLEVSATGSPPGKRSQLKGRVGHVGWSTESVEDGPPASLSGSAEAATEEFCEAAASLPAAEPMTAAELNDIAIESSQAERRAADAERELIEWKKMRFMADKVGDDFQAIILSVTKYGFFVELDDMFVEGLVPIASLQGDHYAFRETDRSICGARTGHCFRPGQRVEVLLDRIDRQARRLQFALLPGTEPQSRAPIGSVRSRPSEQKKIASKGKPSKASKTGGHTKKGKRRKH